MPSTGDSGGRGRSFPRPREEENQGDNRLGEGLLGLLEPPSMGPRPLLPSPGPGPTSGVESRSCGCPEGSAKPTRDLSLDSGSLGRKKPVSSSSLVRLGVEEP